MKKVNRFVAIDKLVDIMGNIEHFPFLDSLDSFARCYTFNFKLLTRIELQVFLNYFQKFNTSAQLTDTVKLFENYLEILDETY